MFRAESAPASPRGVFHRLFTGLGLALVLTMSLAGSASAEVSNVTTNPKATLTSATSAVVSGTIDCTAQETHMIRVVLLQSSGKVNTKASGLVDIQCVGQVQAWSVVINVSAGPSASLKKGPAVATVETYIVNNMGNPHSFPDQTVAIKLG